MPALTMLAVLTEYSGDVVTVCGRAGFRGLKSNIAKHGERTADRWMLEGMILEWLGKHRVSLVRRWTAAPGYEDPRCTARIGTRLPSNTSQLCWLLEEVRAYRKRDRKKKKKG